MSRVKRGVQKRKRKKKILKAAKGFKWQRKSNYKLAKQAVIKAWTYQYRDRRTKKRQFRIKWQAQINKELQKYKISYSKFISNLKKAKIELNRKMLYEICDKHPKIFKAIIEKTSK